MNVIIKSECFDCGEPSVEHHHVVPQSLGGKRTVPLCVRCHDLVHGGLGINRIHHKELTTRALNKKQPFEFHYVWWHTFKCADEEDYKEAKEIANDLQCGVKTVHAKIKRIVEMDPKFLEELCLPYAGYEYYGTSVFNLEPFDLTDDDIAIMKVNRINMDKNITKELGMTY